MADNIIKPDTSNILELQDAGATSRLEIIDGGTTLLRDEGGTSALIIGTDGAITKPIQPSFLAKATSQTNIPINTQTTITFATEIFDQGGNFDTSAYTFNAPVAGKYLFTVVLIVTSTDSAADYFSVALFKGGSEYTRLSMQDEGQFNGDPVYWSFSGSTLMDMDASDTALIRVYQAAGTAQADIDTMSSFSGFLVA